MAFAAQPSYAAENAYIVQSERYVDCTVKSRSNSALALQEANKWFAETNDPAAQHCVALSLYNMGKYQEAAESLEKLAKQVGDDQAAMKTSIMTQAAYSWKMLKNHDKADAAYKSAIATAVNNNMNDMATNLLYERALMNNGRQNNLLAMQDLDHVISLDENNVQARMLRAKIYEEMSNTTLAKEDYAAILKAKPDHDEAARNIERLGGIVPEIAPVPPPPKIKVAKAKPVNTNKPVAVPKPSGVDSDTSKKKVKAKPKTTKKSTKSKSSKSKKKKAY